MHVIHVKTKAFDFLRPSPLFFPLHDIPLGGLVLGNKW